MHVLQASASGFGASCKSWENGGENLQRAPHERCSSGVRIQFLNYCLCRLSITHLLVDFALVLDEGKSRVDVVSSVEFACVQDEGRSALLCKRFC